MIQTKEAPASALQAIAVGPTPEPTRDYYERSVNVLHAGLQAIPIPAPKLPSPKIPIPWPMFTGSRFRIWKQDPSVGDPGVRLTYLPGYVANGPRDARIESNLPGTTPVARNLLGDFVFTPGTSQMDAAHTFAVVRHTLSMYERVLREHGLMTKIPWAWNTGTNTAALTVHPRAGVTPNAYYSRSQKALKFFYFTPSGASAPIYTCRSLDIVSHETGHAVLDGLKPGWLGAGNVPQTGGLHESFGDLSAIFLALSQMDQVEVFISITRANLHAKNFLAEVAEQFGNALGRPNGLRNADNNLKLSQVGTEVHAISQVFTGGVYDVLADIFDYEKYQKRYVKDASAVLYDVARYVCGLVVRALVAAPNTGATYFDVVKKMLSISLADGQPSIYRTFIKNRFTLREVLAPGTPFVESPDLSLTGLGAEYDDVAVKAGVHDDKGSEQDRSRCCGTMQASEYVPFPGGNGKLHADLDSEELESAMLSAQESDIESTCSGH